MCQVYSCQKNTKGGCHHQARLGDSVVIKRHVSDHHVETGFDRFFLIM